MALADWVVGARLGEGGMGEVFASTHARFGRAAALKRLRSDLLADSVARTGFETEIAAIARIDHPAVVRVLDQGRDPDGAPWFVMERAAGTLGPPADWDALRRALDAVLQGLAAAHGAGVLHLDVKASNVLVRADGSHALSDFGVAHAIGGARHGAFGSPRAMAPERFDGRPERLTEATDLYAVGCLAFELAHGAPPFASRTWDEAAREHAEAPVPELLPRLPVPAGLARWIGGLLAKRPGERFRSAADARAALAALAGGVPVVVRRGGFAPASTTRLTRTVAGVATPIDALLPLAAAPGGAPIPERWPEAPARRREDVGLGLLGLLAVPFTGREVERAALWDGLRAAGAGGFRALVLDGPVGVGRSRLGRELLGAAVSVGAVGLRVDGRGPAPCADAVRRWAGLTPDADRDREAEAIALRLGLPLRDPAVRAVLAEGLPPLARALSRDRTVALFVDDALADPDALRAVEAIAGERPARVLLVVGAGARDRSSAPDRAARLDACAPDRLVLASLAEVDCRRLLADWVGLRPARVAELAAHCEGDVGLAISLVEQGVRAGVLAPVTAGLDAPDRARLEPPPAERDRWTLPELGVEREAAWVAAALGADVDLALWARITGDRDACARAAAALEAAGLLAERPGGWRWASPIPRQMLLDTAPDAARHHRACADALPGAEHAWRRGGHRIAAGEIDAGLRDLFAGASEAIASGSMARASVLLADAERALVARGVPASSPHWGALWQTHALLGPTHQGYSRCRGMNERVVACARDHLDDPDWFRMYRAAVGNMIWLSHVQLLPRAAEPWVAIFSGLVDQGRADAAALEDNRGWLSLIVGESDASCRAFTRALELAKGRGNRRLTFVADASLGVAKSRRGDPDAVDHLERAGRAMLDAGYLSARADLAAALGDAERAQGRFERAAEHYAEALRAEAEGEARSDPGFRLGLALLHRARGHDELAREEIARCRALLTDHGPAWEGSLAVHHASVGGRADLRLALEQLRGSGLVDPDLPESARRVAARADADAWLAFADEQERAIADGRVRR